MLAAAVRLVIAIVDAAVTAFEKRRAATHGRAFDPRRPHLWDAEALPTCAYCQLEQTDANVFMLCPATGDPPK